MAENGEHARAGEESMMDRIAEKLHFKEEKQPHHHDDSSSSSSSDDEPQKPKMTSSETSETVSGAGSTVKAKISRLFGREKPVHQVLGGGKPADVFMWKNKKVSAGVLGTATVIWILFEVLEYHLLTLVCHTLILSLAMLFLWTNAITFINKSPPAIPEVTIPEQPFLQVAAALRHELNRGFTLLHDVATGKDVKKFLAVVAGLWLLSLVGKSMDFLTLFYINFVLLHTLPVIYEKYEDQIEFFAEKAMVEGKKHYGVVNERYISKIPRGPLKSKKDE